MAAEYSTGRTWKSAIKHMTWTQSKRGIPEMNGMEGPMLANVAVTAKETAIMVNPIDSFRGSTLCDAK